MAIDLLPRHTEEQRPRLHPPTVISKRPNFDGALTDDPGATSSRDKLVQSHAAESKKGSGCPSLKTLKRGSCRAF
jgi:hypothetical protein